MPLMGDHSVCCKILAPILAASLLTRVCVTARGDTLSATSAGVNHADTVQAESTPKPPVPFSQPGASPAPLALVPDDHWSYEAVRRLSKSELGTYYPEWSRMDRRATRVQLAVVTAQGVQCGMSYGARISFAFRQRLGAKPAAIQRVEHPTSPAVIEPKLPIRNCPAGACLRLLAEYTPELQLLGYDVHQLREEVFAWKQLWPTPSRAAPDAAPKAK